MPTYEYHCSNCNQVKEIVQKINDPVLTVCPDCCQETLTKRLPTSFTIQFKGSGFYATDYQKNSSCCGGCGAHCSKHHDD